MAQIAIESLTFGHLLKRSHPWMESDGYGLEVYTTAAVMGQVMLKTGAVWAAITVVPSATDTIGIVLDATKEDSTKKRILVKGEAVVGASALTYFGGATNPNKLAVNALLEARNIQVNTQI